MFVYSFLAAKDVNAHLSRRTSRGQHFDPDLPLDVLLGFQPLLQLVVLVENGLQHRGHLFVLLNSSGEKFGIQYHYEGWHYLPESPGWNAAESYGRRTGLRP